MFDDDPPAAARPDPGAGRPTPPRRMRVTAPTGVRAGHLPWGDPAGIPGRIGVTSRYLVRDGRPWFPVTGEIHFARTPRERWSQLLGQARACGLDSVSSYLFWHAHEPRRGEFHWDGNLDLRTFVQLAGDHGLLVVVRPGPWVHAEARYGGLPDWVVRSGARLRTDDPEYLALVRPYYAQVVEQLRGLTHAEGGPVVGFQADNEVYDQPEHLATLRSIAEDELGLRVPLWTATGWGGAQVPATLLPLYSAYADGFWEDSQTEWPEFSAFHYRYSEVRDDLSVGADLREGLDGVSTQAARARSTNDDSLPFALCEMGGGMHVAYHRRPLVTGHDVAALALAKIGSGSVWQGYYMFAGGTQRTDGDASLQESHATGYPNDVPSRSYDWHAPIGELGQVNEHYHLLRRQHLWLAEEGSWLATATAHVGGGSPDPQELRWAVRSDGHRGYAFVTTYQPPRRPIAAQAGVQLAIAFDDDTVTAPTSPVDVPAGVSVAWPLRYPLGAGLTLRSATAQVLTRLAGPDGDLVVLSATSGVPVELVLDGSVAVGGAGTGRPVGASTAVDLVVPPGPRCVVELPGVRLMVLDEASANRLYALDVAGRPHLVLADQPVHCLAGDLVAHAEAGPWTLSVLPADVELSTDGASISAPEVHGPWRTWSIAAPGAGAHEVASGLLPAFAAFPTPTRGGPLDRLGAPTDWSGAAQVRVEVPAALLDGVDRVLLRTTWSGDVGRAFVGGELVSDCFWYGRTWDVDLTPWRTEVAADGVTLEMLPWRRASGVWVDPSVRDAPDGITVSSVEVVRVARVVLHASRTRSDAPQ